MTELKTYTPELIKETPLELDKESTSYNEKLSAIANKNGIIEVELEENVVKQRIAKDLYSSYQSGIRELYNNEARACREAKKLGAENPRIEITLNADEHKLIIHGKDSLGITVDVFDKVLRRLGVSGNLSGDEIGQFGFGFASYTTLSDLVIVETYARETDEKYAFMGKNGIDLQILPQPRMKEYGTKLVLTYGDNVNEREVIRNIVELSRFSKVPTRLIMEHDIIKPDNSYVTSRSGKLFEQYYNSGEYDIPHYDTLKEYNDKLLIDYMTDEHRYRTYSGLGWKIEFHIDNPDFEFHGYLARAKPTTNGWDREGVIQNYHAEVLLVGTKIGVSSTCSGLSTYVINIKNERKYKPTADRDRLTDEAIDLVLKPINEYVQNQMKNYSLTSLEDYKNSEYKELYTTVQQESICYIEDIQTRTIVRALESWTYSERGNRGGNRLEDIVTSDNKYDKLVILDKIDDAVVSELKTHFPKPYIFRLADRSAGFFHELVNLGVLDGKEYLKSKKIKINRFINSNGDRVYIVHKSHIGTSGWGNYEEIRKTTGKMAYVDMKGRKTLQEEGENLKSVFKVLGETLSDYLVVRKHKTLTGMESLPELCKRVESLKVSTSLGEMTLSEIAKLPHKEVVVYTYRYPDVVKYMKNKQKKLFIVSKIHNETFEICCYLIGKKKMEFDKSGDLITKMFYKDSINFYGSGYYRASYILDLLYGKKCLDEEVYDLFISGVGASMEEVPAILDKAIQVQIKLDKRK